jgi:hypothetical protein
MKKIIEYASSSKSSESRATSPRVVPVHDGVESEPDRKIEVDFCPGCAIENSIHQRLLLHAQLLECGSRQKT